MANILKELFRREGKDNSSATNVNYKIGVDAKNVILSNKEDDSREAYTNLADKLKIFNKMNNIRLTTTEDLKKIGNASGELAHAEGVGTVASGNGSHAEGHNTEASNQDAHAEGYTSIASGYASHAEGSYFGTFGASDMQRTIASGPASHAEGTGTQAKGGGSHSEGVKTVAEGEASHAEGSITQALAKWSHAEGVGTTVEEAAKGGHAEGRGTVAGDEAAHAEGFESKALGYITHAEGWKTEARAQGSHTEGLGTIAAGKYQHVQGKYNVEDTADSNGYGQYAHIVGWGASDQRANIHTLSTEGDAYFAGNISAGKENENSEIKGNLIVDGKITAKLGLVNESGSEDFKTENLQVDKVAIFGEGHSIPNQNPQWEENLFEKSGSIEINKIEYLVFESLDILNSPGTLEWEANKPLSAYYGTILAGSLLGAEDGVYEAGITWYRANAYYPIFFKIDKPNFIMYAPKDEMSGISLNTSREVFLSFKYILKDANAFKNSGVLIQGQFSDLSSNEAKSLVHVIGGGTSEEDRKNIYTLDKDGNAWFNNNLTIGKNFINGANQNTFSTKLLNSQGVFVSGSGHSLKEIESWGDIEFPIYVLEAGSVLNENDYSLKTDVSPIDKIFPLPNGIEKNYYKYAYLFLGSNLKLNKLEIGRWYLGKGQGYRWREDNLILHMPTGGACYIFTNLQISDPNTFSASSNATILVEKEQNFFSQESFANGSFIGGCYGEVPLDKGYLCVMGNGTSSAASNAYVLDMNGNAEYSGDITVTINGEKISISNLLNRIKALENK